MAIASTLGSVAGKSAAYIVEGTRLGASQFSTAAKAAYVEKSAEIRAKRLALSAEVEVVMPAAAPQQRKVRVARA